MICLLIFLHILSQNNSNILQPVWQLPANCIHERLLYVYLRFTTKRQSQLLFEMSKRPYPVLGYGRFSVHFFFYYLLLLLNVIVIDQLMHYASECRHLRILCQRAPYPVRSRPASSAACCQRRTGRARRSATPASCPLR